MIEAIQNAAFTGLSYCGTVWGYVCNGAQSAGNWIGVGIMRLLGS